MGSQEFSLAVESCWELPGRVFGSNQSGISQVGSSRSSALGQLCAGSTQALVPVRGTRTSTLGPFCLQMPA